MEKKGGVTMKMNRNQKELGKENDYRTIEYLELKYDTDIQRGLTLAKVRQKQRETGYYKNSRTKEKKRIWFTCLRQEYQNLLFFLYLCMVSILFQFDHRVKVILFISFTAILFLKAEKVFRYSKVIYKQEEMYSPKAVVLRENTFQCIQVNGLIKGDIVRLKREKKVPIAVISLKPPYKEYKAGEVFAENTGRAIVTQQAEQAFFENVEENTTQNMILQELFIRQGIYFQPDFFKKATVEETRPIVAVGFEEIYFPSKFQVKKFQLFMQKLKKTGVKWFFFSNEDRENAFAIGKKTGIVKEKREVIDRKQFLLLKNVVFEKQIESIRIYCGLSELEKKQVIAMWEKHLQEYSQESLQKRGRIFFMSGLNQRDKEKITKNCVYACCNGGNQEGDIWFRKNWRDTMVKYLTGENIWRKFFRYAKKWEKQILESLCIFMLLSILLSLYIPQQGNMQNIMQTGSLFCAAYIVGKEIVQEGFRKWFLKKLL